MVSIYIIGLLVAVGVSSATAQIKQGIYGQCAGVGYTDPVECGAGLYCSTFNPYYGQCLSTPTEASISAISTTKVKCDSICEDYWSPCGGMYGGCYTRCPGDPRPTFTPNPCLPTVSVLPITTTPTTFTTTTSTITPTTTNTSLGKLSTITSCPASKTITEVQLACPTTSCAIPTDGSCVGPTKVSFTLPCSCVGLPPSIQTILSPCKPNGCFCPTSTNTVYIPCPSSRPSVLAKRQ